MSEAAIAVTNLTKVFPIPFQRRVVVAVRDLNLRVESGQIYGLLGPNGSGKSTTLKIILGLVSPTKGATAVFGRDSALTESRELVGFLPESPFFPKYLTGAEMLRFYGQLSGLRRGALRQRVDELLKLVGLTSARDRRLGGFSKGMLQRIGLAQALINDPKLVVLDEPTAGVDPHGSVEICQLILDLKHRGVTVLLSSHLLAQVQDVCDSVGILANGVLVREGTVSELLSIANRTDLLIENASAEVLREISATAERGGARILETRPAQRSLERVFLDSTKQS
ncbi:MAG: ABC transporter ATP-binding protein [Chthoniobacterales bacterium]